MAGGSGKESDAWDTDPGRGNARGWKECDTLRWCTGEDDVPISRISQYITRGPQQRLAGLYLALLLPPIPTPAIVHTVLIGIHCRPSDLFRRLPAECRARCPDTWEFLRVTRSPDHPSPPLSFSSHAGG